MLHILIINKIKFWVQGLRKYTETIHIGTMADVVCFILDSEVKVSAL